MVQATGDIMRFLFSGVAYVEARASADTWGGPGCTTSKGASVKGVSKRVKHSRFGFTCAKSCTNRLAYQYARNFLASVAPALC